MARSTQGGTGRGEVSLSNSHGARPVHLIITMIKWIRTSSFSIKKSLSDLVQLVVQVLLALVFVPSSGLRVEGLGFRVEGVGCRV